MAALASVVMAPANASLLVEGQAGKELAALGCTLAVALVSGYSAGSLPACMPWPAGGLHACMPWPAGGAGSVMEHLAAVAEQQPASSQLALLPGHCSLQ